MKKLEKILALILVLLLGVCFFSCEDVKQARKLMYGSIEHIQTESEVVTVEQLEEITEPIKNEEPTIFYKTVYGEKYHKEDCKHIRDRTVKELLKVNKLQPCLDCKPNT